jgi:hypothetical protein
MGEAEDQRTAGEKHNDDDGKQGDVNDRDGRSGVRGWHELCFVVYSEYQY